MYNAVHQSPRRLLAGLLSAALIASLATTIGAPAQAAETATSVPSSQSAAPAALPMDVEDDTEFSALLFTKTAGFRHANIPTGIAAIEQMGAENGFTVDSTEDAEDFTDENLANYDVVIWFSTTGDVLNDDQQAAFERYIQSGGGYAGVHAASDTEYNWEWYEGLVGAYFQGHPAPQSAELVVEDHVHPSTSHLGDRWDRFDEWYSFRSNPRDDVHVLLSLDETTYSGGGMGADHPAAWCHVYDGGNAWYTAGGHTDESFAEEDFLEHLLQGFRTAAGVEQADCNASQSSSNELVTLDGDTGNPMSLNVLEDGTVFYIERDGRVRHIDSQTQQVSTALNLDVSMGNEDGLLGFVTDPDFDTNNWAYIYYSPATVSQEDGPHNKISRFTYQEASKTFDPDSEVEILKVETQRDECCHAGGDMVFDLDGNLMLATGDNTNPFASNGYTPIDERDGRSAWDAQATSGNTNDLRGKIVRITPQDDGTYTIPEGNLFEEGTDLTRPEIYAMGFRNPFRIDIDPHTGNLLVADYGPDAGSANPNRGPAATTEWNIVDEPGNYGWPFCHGVKCYNDYNFANGASGDPFDPNALVNDSPNNTGLTELPPVIEPEYWGEMGASDNPWPIVGNNGYTGAPMAGPAYQFDPLLESDTKFPEYWDGKAIFGDWNDGEAFTFHLNQDDTDAPRGTQIVGVTPMLAGMLGESAEFYRVMDASWGPDGSLYVIDWGSGFGGDNANSGVYRIDYVKGNPSPIARASADVTNGAGSTLEVNFSSEGTRHPASVDYTVEWDFGDGSEPSSEEHPTHTYQDMGEYTARMTVTDEDGRFAIATVNIVVGNAAPTVNIVFPEQGGFFHWGDEVEYEVIIDDPDGTVNCDNVEVLPALGHDSHQHPMGELSGCEGTIVTARDDGHGITENIFWVVDVRYTDDGGAVGVPLTAYGTNILNPKRLEAEFFVNTGVLTDEYPDNTSNGVQIEANGDYDGGQNLSYVEPGDWWSYDPVHFQGIDGMEARLAVPEGSGYMTIHWESLDSEPIGTLEFSSTGAWQDYEYFQAEFTDLPNETGTLYFVHREGQVNVNYFSWNGEGVRGNSVPMAQLHVDPVSGSAPLVVNATVSAVDPEGDDVTFEWDQGTGDGFVAGGESEQFIYEEVGQYMLRVRAFDESGGYSEEYARISVEHNAVHMCFAGRSDDFTDTELDTDRWDGIVRPNQEMRVEDGELIIPATLTDIYQDSGNDVPNIVLQDLPEGAWEATAKVTFPARDQYQQAGLIVYGDDDNYTKMVIQARASSAAERVFQLASETNGSAQEDNTANLGAAYPDTVYVRLISDGSSITGAYSADGQTFTEMSQTYSIDTLVNPRIGLTAFANPSSPGDVVDAHFDWFYISPDDTAGTPGPNDEFDGDNLDTCRWLVVNEDPAAYRVTDGSLEIDPAAADIYQGATGVTNFVVQDVPGDWMVETKVDASELSHQYQQGGLIARADDDNYVKINFVARNAAGSSLQVATEMLSEVDGSVTASGSDGPASDDGIVWLRLTKTGDVFTGATSVDGETWVDFADEFTNAGAAQGSVGLFALGTDNQTETPTVRFDYFRVVDGGDDQEPDELELDVTLSPADPDGAADWYTSAVTVDVAVTGGGDSTVYRETKVNDGGWNEFTAPIEVSDDGEHTVYVRASGPGVETVEESISFKIDATAPAVSATADTSSHPRTLTVTGTDGGSGIDSLEYRIGNGAWTQFTTPVQLSDAAQSITARATDVAGNVSADTTIQVPAHDSGGGGNDGDGGTQLTFTDVKAGQTQFYTQIMWLANEGISRGWNTPSGNEFRPYNNINRDAMAAFLYRYAGSPKVTLPARSPFVDVTPSTQFYKEIVWLHQEGISNGWATPNGQEFRPYEPIARDAMAAFLYRYADRPAWTPPARSPFGDITPSTQFYKEITWLESTGISSGWTNFDKPQYRPHSTTNRDAMAAFLFRYNQVIGR